MLSCASVSAITHREPAPDVSDEEESVVFEVAHHGVAATQLRGPPVSLVVVADGAVTDHGQNIREDPLVATEERGDNVSIEWIPRAFFPVFSSPLSLSPKTHIPAVKHVLRFRALTVGTCV